MNNEHLLHFFIEAGLMTPIQADDVLVEATQNAKSIEQAIVDNGIFEEEQLYLATADALGTRVVDLSEIEFTPDILHLVPAGLARLQRALPVGEENGAIQLVLADPLDSQTAEDLRFALGREIEVLVAPRHQIEERLRQYYGEETSGMEELLREWDQSGEITAFSEQKTSDSNIEAEANARPIIRFVDLILYQAIKDQASDVHFEPFQNEFKVRYRVDGALYEMAPPPRHLALPVISRLKVMANLDIAERRLPQDGRIRKNIAGRKVDLRVSTLPTQFGESVVLRVLDRSTADLDLGQLGMPQGVLEEIEQIITQPNGIFIATGPTGSGKTTTLYSCLRKINRSECKLLTAEDPIEYDLEGIIQVPVNDGVGLTFARVLRAFLRHDPDHIMVGEMRDLPTAQIAIQAALTGHLVFTTLHTNDAPGAIPRLLDMGVEAFLISSTLQAVLAQRLLRRICPACCTTYLPNDSLLAELHLCRDDLGHRPFQYGRGCAACNQTGYKGRIAVYELMRINDLLRDLINERAPAIALKEKAMQSGMATLRQDALRSLFQGLTTVEEVLRYT